MSESCEVHWDSEYLYQVPNLRSEFSNDLHVLQSEIGLDDLVVEVSWFRILLDTRVISHSLGQYDTTNFVDYLPLVR